MNLPRMHITRGGGFYLRLPDPVSTLLGESPSAVPVHGSNSLGPNSLHLPRIPHSVPCHQPGSPVFTSDPPPPQAPSAGTADVWPLISMAKQAPGLAQTCGMCQRPHSCTTVLPHHRTCESPSLLRYRAGLANLIPNLHLKSSRRRLCSVPKLSLP